jgi:hypothetical protein
MRQTTNRKPGLQIPAGGSSPRGCKVRVAINTWDGREWTPSSVMQASDTIMYYEATLVVSEDSIDNDWNDAVSR